MSIKIVEIKNFLRFTIPTVDDTIQIVQPTGNGLLNGVGKPLYLHKRVIYAEVNV